MIDIQEGFNKQRVLATHLHQAAVICAMRVAGVQRCGIPQAVRALSSGSLVLWAQAKQLKEMEMAEKARETERAI